MFTADHSFKACRKGCITFGNHTSTIHGLNYSLKKEIFPIEGFREYGGVINSLDGHQKMVLSHNTVICVLRQLNIDNCNLIEDCEPEEFFTKEGKCLNKTKDNLTLSSRKSRLSCSGSPSKIKWHANNSKLRHLIMDTILLNVKTVQAFEPVTYEAHKGQLDKAGSRGFLAGDHKCTQTCHQNVRE